MFRILISVFPFAVIATLLYGAIFVKPKAQGHPVPTPVVARGDFMYGIDRSPDGAIWTAGSDGKVWRSDDLGKSWTAFQTSTQATLQDIAVWDKARAVAVGNDGVIVRTEDGGTTWLKVDAPRSKTANKLMRVRAADAGQAWTVGEMGAAMRSADYGATWQRVLPEKDAAWNDVFVSGRKVWVAGEFGRIRYSIDGGSTWSDAATPVKTSLMGISFRDDLNGVAVGLDGVVITSHDGGVNWSAAERVSTVHLLDVLWDGATWVVVGDKGVVLRATSEAADWEKKQVSPSDRGWHTKVIASGSDYLAVGQSFARLAKSADARRN